MKKIGVIIVLLASALTLSAQHHINSFFGQQYGDRKVNGVVRFETQELDTASNYLAAIEHRSEDVVWSRIVYRVIDMRYKQNYQLYFPTNTLDPQYKSLIQVMIKAIEDGTPIYGKDNFLEDIRPMWEREPLGNRGKSASFAVSVEPDYNSGEYSLLVIAPDSSYADSTDEFWENGSISFDPHSFDYFIAGQVKFLIQEIVFFDKHYSQLYTKILGIAPLDSRRTDGVETIAQGLWKSLCFWMAYDDLRPYLARQYMIPKGDNDTKRLTYEQFFAQKLYSSYLIGDCNMYTRLFSTFAEKNNKLKVRKPTIPEDVMLQFQDSLDLVTLDEEEMAAIRDEALFGERTVEEMVEEQLEEKRNSVLDELKAEYYGPVEEIAAQVRRQRIINDLRKEQERVEAELLNFEVDLWEY